MIHDFVDEPLYVVLREHRLDPPCDLFGDLAFTITVYDEPLEDESRLISRFTSWNGGNREGKIQPGRLKT